MPSPPLPSPFPCALWLPSHLRIASQPTQQFLLSLQALLPVLESRHSPRANPHCLLAGQHRLRALRRKKDRVGSSSCGGRSAPHLNAFQEADRGSRTAFPSAIGMPLRCLGSQEVGESLGFPTQGTSGFHSGCSDAGGSVVDLGGDTAAHA